MAFDYKQYQATVIAIGKRMKQEGATIATAAGEVSTGGQKGDGKKDGASVSEEFLFMFRERSWETMDFAMITDAAKELNAGKKELNKIIENIEAQLKEL